MTIRYSRYCHKLAERAKPTVYGGPVSNGRTESTINEAQISALIIYVYYIPHCIQLKPIFCNLTIYCCTSIVLVSSPHCISTLTIKYRIASNFSARVPSANEISGHAWVAITEDDKMSLLFAMDWDENSLKRPTQQRKHEPSITAAPSSS